MFDHTSRYYSLPTGTHTLPGGRTVTFVRRRFLPDGETLPLLAEVLTVQGERLDQLTARTLGDPLQFWRICDANDAMDPEELTGEPGRALRIPIPQP